MRGILPRDQARGREFADGMHGMTMGYVIKRLLLIIPTLFGIMLITFVLVQFAPGGPVEHMLARINAQSSGHTTLGVEPSHDAK